MFTDGKVKNVKLQVYSGQVTGRANQVTRYRDNKLLEGKYNGQTEQDENA